MSVVAQEYRQKPMLLIGRIGAPWGVKGHTRIQSFTSPETNIFDYDHWYIKQNDQFRPIQCEETRNLNNGLVARLKGVDDRDKAQAMVHAEIYISKEELPECEQDTYYWADLVGLEVVNQADQILGVVDHLYETGQHDNMVVIKEKQTQHIPFIIGHSVMSVDLETKRIIVDWPEGF